jgi:hypothetical protein
MRRTVAVLLAFGVALVSAACSPAPPPTDTLRELQPALPVTATPTPATSTQDPMPTTTSGSPLELKVYFAYQEKMQPAIRKVPHTTAVLKASLTELLKGPTAAEKAKGLSSQIPAGTKLRAVTVSGNVAVVDLTGPFSSGGGTLSMTDRLAQIVYTATQFRGVDAVRFKIDGKLVDVFGGEGIVIDKPQKRADYEYASPAILLDTPAWGSTLSSPARLAGTSNVFEATHRVQIIDSAGKTVYDGVVTATSGTGTRGDWSITATFTPTQTGAGKVRVFDESAKDGSDENVVEVPVLLTK